LRKREEEREKDGGKGRERKIEEIEEKGGKERKMEEKGGKEGGRRK